MAEDSSGGLENFFPPPPPFYKYFTAKNFDRLKKLQESSQAEGDKTKQNAADSGLTKHQILNLPSELRYLIPPELPADGRYRSFGESQDINFPSLTLKEQGLTQLYPSPPITPSGSAEASWTLDRAFYLKKTVRSILLNFLELVGILSQNPEGFEEKIKDLEVLFLNAHALVNEYRPHQARETLILMMEEQVERKKAEIEGVNRMKEKVENVISELAKEGREGTGDQLEVAVQLKPGEWTKMEEKSVWKALHDELGV